MKEMRPLSYPIGIQSYNKNSRHLISGSSTKTNVSSNYDCEEDKLEDHTKLSSLLQFFLQHTTIPGISQVHHRRTWILKIFWALLFCAGISLAFYQSRSLIAKYFKYNIKQVASFVGNNSLPFPAVTFCADSPIYWKKALEKNSEFTKKIKQQLEEKIINNQTLTEGQKLSEGEKLLITNLESLSHEERTNLNHAFNDFVDYCVFDSKECNVSFFHEYNNLHYGNCFTFNPGINQEILRTSQYDTKLILVLKLEKDYLFPYLNRFFGIRLLIHQSGVPPVIDNSNIIWLYPTGNWNQFTVRKTDFKRMKAPFPSKCVNPEDPALRSKNLYYTEDSPYIYSVDACLETCRRDLQYQQCQCIDAVHVTHNQRSKYPVCQQPCNMTAVTRTTESCQCYHPCSESTFPYTWTIDSDWKNFNESIKQLWYIKKYENMTLKEATEYFNNRCTVVMVMFETIVSEIIEEKAEYTTADLWGAIGGNLGLWIGISAISLAEIFEILLFFVSLKLGLCRNKVSPDVQRQPTVKTISRSFKRTRRKANW